jgi:hypothetical protein
MATQETEGICALPAEEPRENQTADDVAASGPFGEGQCQDAAAAEAAAQVDEAQRIAQEERAAMLLPESEVQKGANMERQKPAEGRAVHGQVTQHRPAGAESGGGGVDRCCHPRLGEFLKGGLELLTPV